MDNNFSAYQKALVKFTPKEFEPYISRGFYLNLIRFLNDFQTLSEKFNVSALDMEIISNPWEPTSIQLFLISNNGNIISEPTELQKYAVDGEASNSKYANLMSNLPKYLLPSLPDDDSIKRLRVKQTLQQMNSTSGDFESLRSSEFSFLVYIKDIAEIIPKVVPQFVSDLVLEQKIKKSIKPVAKKQKKSPSSQLNRF